LKRYDQYDVDDLVLDTDRVGDLRVLATGFNDANIETVIRKNSFNQSVKVIKKYINLFPFYF